jgi:hypothetical protein
MTPRHQLTDPCHQRHSLTPHPPLGARSSLQTLAGLGGSLAGLGLSLLGLLAYRMQKQGGWQGTGNVTVSELAWAHLQQYLDS